MKSTISAVLAVVLGCLAGPSPATARPAIRSVPAIDVPTAVRAFADAHAASERDDGRLWGVPLYGPILFVDAATRRVVANRADGEGRLTPEGGGFVGSLPDSVGIANTSVDWAGVRWAMILWPPPDDVDERTSLLLHESFHRIQPSLGLQSGNPANKHLDTESGRYLLRLEWRALGEALGQTGAARTRALSDALAFRHRRRALFAAASADENALELNEGLAEYTGRVLALALPSARVRRLLSDAETTPSFTRSFAYATGPAYGLLLDAAGAKWRSGLSATSDLGALAARAYHIRDAAPAVRSLESRARRYGGAAIRRDEALRERSRREREALAMARYVDGPVLVIPLQKMQISFDPNTLVPLGDVGTVYPTLEIRDRWGTLVVTDGALVSADWSRVTVPLGPEDAGALSSAGWRLELSPGWRVGPGPRSRDRSVLKN